MRRTDGLSATRQIRALCSAISWLPIVALTANVLSQQVTEFRAAGIDDHIGKPFWRDALLGVVDRWTNGGSKKIKTLASVDLALLSGIKGESAARDRLVRTAIISVMRLRHLGFLWVEMRKPKTSTAEFRLSPCGSPSGHARDQQVNHRDT